MNYKEKIKKENLPSHVAIIMDGNGRWAKKKGNIRIFGHQNAVKSVRDIVEASVEVGIKYLTLYAFSTENWNRPKIEVNALMSLLVSTINSEMITLNENNVRLAGGINERDRKHRKRCLFSRYDNRIKRPRSGQDETGDVHRRHRVQRSSPLSLRSN